MATRLGDYIDQWIAENPDRRTLGQLSRDTGISVSFLSRIRRGERVGGRGDTIARLSQVLGVPVDVLRDAAGLSAGPPLPPMTFREFVEKDRRLTQRQREGLLHMYYETFGIVDDNPAAAQ